MRLHVLPDSFSVCQVADIRKVDLSEDFFFLGKTKEEISLVCKTQAVPREVTAREDGWKGFYIEEVLDFSLIGILSNISGILAGEGIGIFAVSTYNTDYILTKEEIFKRALLALQDAGYEIEC